jgi:ribonuclease HI
LAIVIICIPIRERQFSRFTSIVTAQSNELFYTGAMEPTWKLKKVKLFIGAVCTSDRVGPGGWACRLHFQNVVSEMFGCDPKTTANRMVLRAAIAGLRVIKQRCRVNLLTNSDYLYNGMTRWLPKWKTNGWQTETGEVKNQELWKELGEVAAQHVMRWSWLKSDGPDISELQVCEKLALEAASQQTSSPLMRKLSMDLAPEDTIPTAQPDEEVKAVGANC